MTDESLSLVYMGTPDFAVLPLLAIHESRHRILRVITQPDRPKGRGRRVTEPPVKKAARQHGYDVVQPTSAKGDDFFKLCFEPNPDLLVVAAYGNILPQAILSQAPLGAVNIHASLLPRYRGAAPIQWAIINGEDETGITTMQMDAGMDTGDILLSARTPIGPADTAEVLHDRLATMGADLVVETLDLLAAGKLQAIPQDDSQATVAPLLKKGDGQIDWHQSAIAIERLIRGVTPWPGAYMFLNDRRLKIFRAQVVGSKGTVDSTDDTPPGTVVKGFADELRVATGDGILSLLELQGASGKRLSAADYLRGHALRPGTVFK